MEKEIELALLKNDVGRVTSLVEKLDSAIEKMGEVSGTIAKILAVHEEKIAHHDRIDDELFNLLEKRRGELQMDVKELHSRISSIQRELSENISNNEHKIMAALMNGLMDIKKCISEEHRIFNEDRSKLEKRIEELEKWRWIIMGGSIVVGVFAEKIISLLLIK